MYINLYEYIRTVSSHLRTLARVLFIISPLKAQAARRLAQVHLEGFLARGPIALFATLQHSQHDT